MMSAPDARTSSGRIALTVAAVPTGMNAGVRISPRGIAMMPVRAAPSVAEIVKAKRVTAPGPTRSCRAKSRHVPRPSTSLGANGYEARMIDPLPPAAGDDLAGANRQAAVGLFRGLTLWR